MIQLKIKQANPPEKKKKKKTILHFPPAATWSIKTLGRCQTE